MRKQNRTQFLQKAKEEYDFWTVTHKRNSKPCPKEDDSVRCYICRWYQSNGSTHREDKGMPQMCCSCSYLLTVLELKDVLREFVVEGIVRYRDTFSDLKQVNKWAVLSDEESWNKFLDEVINHKDEEGMDLR